MPIRDNVDITKNSLPSFEVFGDWFRRIVPEGREQADITAKLFRRGYIRYRLMSLEKA